ncbi:Eco57I restriction-modification methylase domain-containing protein [Nocardia transvalensis]|uniref:Eco57I restriction-modification methylase domain-containing protein n=1 Tax=Nocardia transvalensis TaxID=37333 RepID=UPI001894B8BF|nr:N-6 DNA methylase [Nocardia transvalensis]MBF6330345.1 N-6 DNA methylase [Nocardia transvalensis]
MPGVDGWGGQASGSRRVDRPGGGGAWLAEGGGERARKRHGRHYTPQRLARFLAERLFEHVMPPGDTGELRILDPACGDGELLVAARQVAARRFPEARLRLVGYDLDGEAVRAAAARDDGVGIEWRVGEFLGAAATLADGEFDAIITNPPYVRTQQLGAATARLLSRRFGLQGRIDLTHPFVASVPRLLRPGGVLGLLCANRFLTTKAGANLRALLRSQLTPVELYDLGDTRLFEAAVLPAVTIAVRGEPAMQCTYVSAYETEGVEPCCDTNLFTILTEPRDCVIRHDGRCIAIEVGTLATESIAPQQNPAASRLVSATADFTVADHRGADSTVPWRMSRPGTDAWLRRVSEGTWRTFGELARIRVGIKTTADRVFISDRWEEREPRPETELLFDLLTHHDMAPWRVARERATRVLYPYDVARPRRTPVDLSQFPGTAAYLAEHKDTLAARDYLTASGREWFEIWVPQRPHLWRQPKVVFPDISVRPRFALDRSGAIVNGDCYWISLPDIGDDTLAYVLMGVANSTLGLRFYDAVCGNRLYAGRRRWITQYVARLPVPDPRTPAAAALADWVRALVEGGDPDPIILDERVAAAFELGSPTVAFGPR